MTKATPKRKNNRTVGRFALPEIRFIIKLEQLWCWSRQNNRLLKINEKLRRKTQIQMGIWKIIEEIQQICYKTTGKVINGLGKEATNHLKEIVTKEFIKRAKIRS